MSVSTAHLPGLNRRPSILARFADSERWVLRALLVPAILYILLLLGVPSCQSLFYRLSDACVGGRASNFIGLQNVARVIDSVTFWRSLTNTILLTALSQCCVLVLASILALALVADFR